MQPRLVGALAALAVAAFGCAGGTRDGAAPRAEAVPAPTAAAPAPTAAPPGSQVVQYGGIELTVPDTWPVYDLAAAPATCVRFDVHAVYLGTPSPDMQCPAQAIGRADAVLVEPGSGVTQRESGAGPDAGGQGLATADVNGLALDVDSSGAVEHELVVTAPDAAVTVTLSFGETDATAQRILASMRRVG
jgi:hypothetical protein